MPINNLPIRSESVATIPNGAAIMATGADMEGGRLFGIIMPSTWTAAVLTFQASYNGVDFFDLYDSSGTEISYTVAASRFVLLTDAFQWLGIKYLKIRSGTSGAPVNQGGARQLTLVVIS